MFWLWFVGVVLVLILVLLLRFCRKKPDKDQFWLRRFSSEVPDTPDFDRETLIRNAYARDKLQKDPDRDEEYDVIIVGSGISALTCGSLVAQHRKSVLILEQNEQLGGLCHTFVEDGFEFSSGVHFCPAQPPFLTLFERLSEGRIQFGELGEDEDLLCSVHVVDSDRDSSLPSGHGHSQVMESFDLPNRDGLWDYLRDRFPNHVDSITRVQEDSAQCVKDIKFVLLVSFVLPVFLRAPVRCLLEFLLGVKYFRFWEVTSAEYLQTLLPGDDTESRAIRAILARVNALAGFTSGPASLHLATLGVVTKCPRLYPVGGSSTFAKEIMATIRKYGGEGYAHAKVHEIVLNENDRAVGVRMGDGTIIRGRKIMTTCGVRVTYEKLLPERVCPPRLMELTEPRGHYCVGFFGFDRPYEELGLPSSCLYFVRDDVLEADLVLEQSQSVDDAPSPPPVIYVGNPNLVHPPKSGCSCLTVAFLCRSSHFDHWEGTRIRNRGPEYEDEKERALEASFDLLVEQYPLLREHCIFRSFATPLSLKHWCGWSTGESLGCQWSQEMHDTCVRKTGGVSGGLVVAGMDTVRAHGIMWASIAGLIAAGKVLESKTLVGGLFAADPIVRPDDAIEPTEKLDTFQESRRLFH